VALDFVPASSQRLNIGLDIPSLNAKAAGTMMCWVRPDVLATNSISEQSVGPPPGTSATSRFFFNPQSTGAFQLGARDTDGGGSFVLTSAVALVAGVWSHVVAVVDIANDVQEVWVNGVLISSGAPAFTNPTFPATNSKNGCVAANDDGTGAFFDGLIEDFRLYDRRLSAAEIETIYACRGIDGIVHGLVQGWRMNEEADGVLAVAAGSMKDVSPASRNIDPINSPVFQPGTIRTRRRVA
jgi:hypothetical protein